MALEIRKTITVQGESKINDKVIVYLSASVSTDGNSSNNITQSIQDPELYQANRVQCRKDTTAFQNVVYEIEDQIREQADTKVL
ncbi:hypothetical protein [Floricoccus penangensis]|uniref:hypothetical protein n=1 Tax=Floricoccus penangensis TaxID=1859475 RepID=UPI0020402F09|nr:hypothetical protein [Floricoccus penangensis]URZ87560.1 hypothetical protein KIW23_00480 [Floricoccus penangensis]